MHAQRYIVCIRGDFPASVCPKHSACCACQSSSKNRSPSDRGVTVRTQHTMRDLAVFCSRVPQHLCQVVLGDQTRTLELHLLLLLRHGGSCCFRFELIAGGELREELGEQRLSGYPEIVTV
jgi:hypothetical protein